VLSETRTHCIPPAAVSFICELQIHPQMSQETTAHINNCHNLKQNTFVQGD